jgi:hypothetical protein
MMPLTQSQIIQSLGEAMSWLDRELNWGVPATELRHLVGRIGELYAALITSGQLALKTNQRGYDVISSEGERVSVKTTGVQDNSGGIQFTQSTLELVDRIIILFMNTEEMQIETLFDGTTEEARALMVGPNSIQKLTISSSKLRSSRRIVPLDQQSVTDQAIFDGYTISALESGTIVVKKGEVPMSPSKPYLREMAAKLGIDILNSQGNPHNTRQLGSLIIKHIQSAAGQT